MDTVPRRRLPALVLHVVLAACLLPVLFKGDSIAASPRTCTELREWAAPYSSSAPALDELAAFDRRHRTAIWNAITPAARSALMGEHLRRWRQNDTSLSPLQRSLITEAAELLTPALYERTTTAAARKDWELFWARAQVAFPAQDQQRQWFEIGPTAISSATDARLAEPDACACNVNHPIWNCEGACLYGDCEDLQWGCGPGLMYPCNGRCA